MKQYDVIVVGAGPAGLFSCLKLVENPKLKILLIDKGKALAKRICPRGKDGCLGCDPCNITSGWGGAGAFSDGKLCFSDQMGGWLGDYLKPKDYHSLLKESEKLWLKFGAPTKIYGLDSPAVRKIKKQTQKVDLQIITFPLRHMGSDGGRVILENIYSFLKTRINILLNHKVKELIISNKTIKGLILYNGEKIMAKRIIMAPGRAGADWLVDIAKQHTLKTECNPVDLGVRVEVPSRIYAPIAKHLYELKVHYKSRTFKDDVRTFCVCPNGEVTMEQLKGNFLVKTVNGHSLAHKKTSNTNFALLVSTRFTKPFHDPILYAKSLAKLANLLSGGIIIQRLKDLVLGQRSTLERLKYCRIKPTLSCAVPGDISLVLPHRLVVDILETLQVLDRIMPGIWDGDTLLYGMEIKLYSCRIQVKNSLETKGINNLFVVGDGAGLTRGLVHASVSGMVAAREILKRST